MKNALLSLTLVSAIGLSQAQERSPVANLVQREKAASTVFQQVNLFEKIGDQSTDVALKNHLKAAEILEIKKENLQQLFEAKPRAIHLDLPFQEAGLSVELVRQELFADGFMLTTDQTSGDGIYYEPGIFYRGVVKNSKKSFAAVTIFKDEVMAVINTEAAGNIVLGKRSDQANEKQYLLFKDRDVKEALPFDCGTYDPDITPEEWQQMQEVKNSASKTVSNCIEAYLEMDYNLVTEKGGATNAANFVTGLFNVVATLYQNEEITVQISEIFAWVTPDNYPTSSMNEALTAFRENRLNFNGDVAHLISRGAPTGGGIAWVDGLCNSFAYAYSYIFNSYDDYPTYSWSANVIAHEMGHNLGSRHTHACVWNGNNTAIDGCGPTAGYSEGCTAALPTSTGGTIMSYCHLVNSVGINFSNGFGTQPGALMRSKVINGSCLTNCGVSCPTITLSKDDVSCYGESDGSASVNITEGGLEPFEFSWSNGVQSHVVNGLAAGTYSTTVYDGNGCAVVSSVVISQPAALTLSTTASNVTEQGAANGSVSLSVAGGTSPYTYLWSNGATTKNISNLVPGTYRVTVTDSKSCTATAEATVEQNVISCTSTISTFPYIESFETGFGLWTQSAVDHFNWSTVKGTTPTSNTGPSKAKSGSFYAFTEASSPNFPAKQAILVSPCYDFNRLVSAKFIFSYCMNGSQMGTLGLEISVNGGNFTPLWSKTGNSGTSWYTVTIDLAAYYKDNVKFRFVGTTGHGELSDMAIDYIQVTGTVPSCNVSKLYFDKIDPLCGGTSTGAITVNPVGGTSPYTFKWSNKKTTQTVTGLAAGTYKITVTDKTGCLSYGSATLTAPTAIGVTLVTYKESVTGAKDGSIDLTASGGAPSYTYKWSNGPTTEDIANIGAGTYTVTITDSNNCTAVKSASVTVRPACTPSATLPHYQGFENGISSWKQETSDYFNWTIHTGTTPSSGTGPLGAAEGSYYAFTESYGNRGKQAWLTTPCLAIYKISNPVLTFSYNMNGSKMGTLAVQVSTNGGSTWSSYIWTKKGNLGKNWLLAEVNLIAYAAEEIKIRFVGIPADATYSDMAIDDIKIQSNGSAPPTSVSVSDGTLIAGFNELLVAPSPAIDYITLSFDSDKRQVNTLKVISLSGVVLLETEIHMLEGSNLLDFDVSSLKSGLYFLQLEREDKLPLNQKFVVSR